MESQEENTLVAKRSLIWSSALIGEDVNVKVTT